MTGLLIDTYAWIEIFRNSPWGRQALEFIEKNSPLAVSVLTMYELQYHFNDLYGEIKTGSFITTILTHAEVIPVDMQISIAAGTIRTGQKKKGNGMGAVDCLILATARIHNLNVLTGDRHFDGLEETIVL